METMNKITVKITVKAPIEKVWDAWTNPAHIKNWTFASDDWHAPYATNDLRVGGEFKTTMAAKDGSMSFDYGGLYTNVQPHSIIEYALADGRNVSILFTARGNETIVTETFDPESENPAEMQRGGWQAILDNFKKYTEAN